MDERESVEVKTEMEKARENMGDGRREKRGEKREEESENERQVVVYGRGALLVVLDFSPSARGAPRYGWSGGRGLWSM